MTPPALLEHRSVCQDVVTSSIEPESRDGPENRHRTDHKGRQV